MTRLTVSSFDGERQVEPATPEDAVAAIRSLGGEGDVSLGEPGDDWLGIAGGPALFFVGYSRAREGLTMQARATNPGSDPMQVVIGGQPTTLTPDYLVPLEVATAAAVHFLRYAEADPAIAWERM